MLKYIPALFGKFIFDPNNIKNVFGYEDVKLLFIINGWAVPDIQQEECK